MSVNATVRTDNMICTDISGVSLDPIVQPMESTDGNVVQVIAGYRITLLREGVGFSESPRLTFKTKEEAESVFNKLCTDIANKVAGENAPESKVELKTKPSKENSSDNEESSLDEIIEKENSLSKAVQNLEKDDGKSFVSEGEKDFVRSMIKQASANKPDEDILARNLLYHAASEILAGNTTPKFISNFMVSRTPAIQASFGKMKSMIKEYLDMADTDTSKELSRKIEENQYLDAKFLSDCIYCILGNLKSAKKFRSEILHVDGSRGTNFRDLWNNPNFISPEMKSKIDRDVELTEKSIK